MGLSGSGSGFRPPSAGASPGGPAGGDLAGTYPNPAVIALEETSSPARLALAGIPDGDFLRRVGGTIVGAIPTGTGTLGQFPIEASSVWASLTNGASPGIAQIETAINKVNTFVCDFASGLQGFAEFDAELPSDYDGGTMTAVFYWLAVSASLNSVVWGMQARAYSDGLALDQAHGAAVEVTDANNGTRLVNISAQTAAMTLAGMPAAGQHMQGRIYRLGSGADNLAADARFLGLMLSYTRL